MIRTLKTCTFAAIAAAGIAACGSVDDEKAKEFADAVAVLSAEDEILADPTLAGQEIVLPPPFENNDWGQTLGEPEHSLIHVAAPTELRRLWRQRVISAKAKGAPVTSPPVVGGDYLYMIDAVASVSAFDRQTGAKIWTTALTPDVSEDNVRRFNFFAKVKPRDLGFGGGVAFADGRVFVTSGFGFMAALDAATGELLWQSERGTPLRNPPTVADDLVIAVNISNEVFARDTETGDEVWTYTSFEEAARFLAAAAPAVEGESVVVPFSSGEVASLNLVNGRPQWQAVISRTTRLNALSTLGDIAGSPVIDRGAVFSVSQAGQMAGIDLRTGTVAWEQSTGGYHTPWIAGETVYVLTNRGELVALNRQDGLVRWNVTLPLFKNEKRRKGRILWAGPVLAGNRLLLTGSEGEMLAVSPQDGEVLDRIKLRGDASLPPIVAQSVVYVMTEDGFVEAYGAVPLPSES